MTCFFVAEVFAAHPCESAAGAGRSRAAWLKTRVHVDLLALHTSQITTAITCMCTLRLP